MWKLKTPYSCLLSLFDLCEMGERCNAISAVMFSQKLQTDKKFAVLHSWFLANNGKPGKCLYRSVMFWIKGKFFILNKMLFLLKFRSACLITFLPLLLKIYAMAAVKVDA